jgi:hypothetical protein
MATLQRAMKRAAVQIAVDAALLKRKNDEERAQEV